MNDTTDLQVDATNTEQLEAWDGGEGAYWAAHADEYDAAVAPYHLPLLDAAAIEPSDRVLDIGCGSGQTTRDAARLAITGSAVGIDLSSRMLDVARSRSDQEGVDNATFVQGDAQVHPFEPASFDVALSRTGSMFFGDQAAAHANIAKALRPGGRLALGVWQPLSENEWFTSFVSALAAGRDLPPPPPDSPNPFSMSDPDRVRPLLESSGFQNVEFADLHAPMAFGATAPEAHDFIIGQLGWLVADLDEDARQGALAALLQTMKDHETADGVQLGSAMWIITATRADR
jgi:SAM-dependent methyltransferase